MGEVVPLRFIGGERELCVYTYFYGDIFACMANQFLFQVKSSSAALSLLTPPFAFQHDAGAFFIGGEGVW